VDDLLEEIRVRSEKNERVLVTTLTKRMSEDLSSILPKLGSGAATYIRSGNTGPHQNSARFTARGILTCSSESICLREGLDLPEVSLVAILDADKGILAKHDFSDPDHWTLRRHIEGRAILYADRHRLDESSH